MPLQRSDYNQALQQLENAWELLERDGSGKTIAIREVLQLAVCRLSPGDHFVGDAAAEIAVLRQVADKVRITTARARY